MEKVYIDGTDIENYGMLTDDYAQYIFQPAECEEKEQVNWFEGGVSVDTSEKIDYKTERKLQISLFMPETQSNFFELENLLCLKNKHIIAFSDFNVKVKARYTGCTNQMKAWGYIQLTLNFTEDDWELPEQTTFSQRNIINYDCYIDNININRYGYMLLKGSLDNIFTKTAIDRLKNATGNIFFQKQEITLKIGSVMATDVYKANSQYFFSRLSASGERQLTLRYEDADIVLKGYVTGIKCTRFLWNASRVFCEYDITFAVTDIQSMRFLKATRVLTHGEITNLTADFYFDLYPVFTLYLVPKDITDKRTELVDVILEDESEIKTIPLVIDDYNDSNIKVFPYTERNIELLDIYRVFYFSAEYLNLSNE